MISNNKTRLYRITRLDLDGVGGKLYFFFSIEQTISTVYIYFLFLISINFCRNVTTLKNKENILHHISLSVLCRVQQKSQTPMSSLLEVIRILPVDVCAMFLVMLYYLKYSTEWHVWAFPNVLSYAAMSEAFLIHSTSSPLNMNIMKLHNFLIWNSIECKHEISILLPWYAYRCQNIDSPLISFLIFWSFFDNVFFASFLSSSLASLFDWNEMRSTRTNGSEKKTNVNQQIWRNYNLPFFNLHHFAIEKSFYFQGNKKIADQNGRLRSRFCVWINLCIYLKCKSQQQQQSIQMEIIINNSSTSKYQASKMFVQVLTRLVSERQLLLPWTHHQHHTNSYTISARCSRHRSFLVKFHHQTLKLIFFPPSTQT